MHKSPARGKDAMIELESDRMKFPEDTNIIIGQWAGLFWGVGFQSTIPTRDSHVSHDFLKGLRRPPGVT